MGFDFVLKILQTQVGIIWCECACADSAADMTAKVKDSSCKETGAAKLELALKRGKSFAADKDATPVKTERGPLRDAWQDLAHIAVL